MILIDGQVRELPTSLGGMLLSPYTRPAVMSMIHEPFTPARPVTSTQQRAHLQIGTSTSHWRIHSLSLLVPDVEDDDESIEHFARRRLGSYVSNVLLPALTIGIYGGSTRHLSIRSCFPALYSLECEHGSIVRGMLASAVGQVFGRRRRGEGSPSVVAEHADSYCKWRESDDMAKQAKRTGVFSFRDGLQSLPDALVSYLSRQPHVQLRRDTRVAALEYTTATGRINVLLHDNSLLEFDHVFSALPANKLGPIIRGENDGLLYEELSSVRFAPMAIVNLVYETAHLSHPMPSAFGYLVPPIEKQPILGVVFESAAFPTVADRGLTAITVMLGGDSTLAAEQGASLDLASQADLQQPDALVTIALDAVRQHLNITAKPLVVDPSIYPAAMPQYTVLDDFVLLLLHRPCRHRGVSLGLHVHSRTHMRAMVDTGWTCSSIAAYRTTPSANYAIVLVARQ